MSDNQPEYDPNLIAAIRKQVLEELKSEEERKQLELKERREEEKKLRAEYIEKMRDSTDPWVDIEGLSQSDQGVRIELDWNNAFVQHLRDNGITGTDDEQVVQHWVTLLLQDMVSRFDEESPEQGDFE